MEASRLGFVRVDVAGDLVAISWHERAWLLEKIETLVWSGSNRLSPSSTQ
jgi:hypothetical protein